MSEFTDCIYLRSTSLRDGVDWLKRNDLRGYLMRPSNGWVQIFPEWPVDRAQALEALQDSESTLVHYQFAADHLWSFAIYVGDTRAFWYTCAWESDKTFEVDGSLEVASRKLGVSKEALDQILYTGDPGATHSTLIESASNFCHLVGLGNHSWAAFRYMRTGGPAILVEPTDFGDTVEMVNLRSLCGVLAKLSISHLAQEQKIVFDPDSRHIRQNLARHLVHELEESSAEDLSQIAVSWHRAMRQSPMIARFRFEPAELERVLEHLVNHSGAVRPRD